MPPARRRPISLPSPLLRRVDALVTAFLSPDSGPAFDFTQPAGEPALTAPDSVSWRVFKNPVALYIGGVAAVILELGEPRVRDAIWQHSDFRSAPLARLRRTGLAAMVTIYGPRSRTEAMIAGIVRRHDKVRGQTSDGISYHANDPRLLDWVQATATFGFMEAYAAFVSPLSTDERNALLAEGRPSAVLYGARGVPTGMDDLDAFLGEMAGQLEPSPIIGEFLAIMSKVKVFPGPSGPFQRRLLRAAVDILPAPIRERLELGKQWSLGAFDRSVVRAAARAADRLVVPAAPAVQACRRLGLPEDYLYRTPGSDRQGSKISTK
ncbi:MAG: DUF2236 domain-containing protein [Bauldia sp.]|nr:DUF2236 domain-containing protein [Bauldia sp.]